MVISFITAVLLGVGVFVFYLATAAPTVLWGDDAFFQWSAAEGYLQADGGGHMLHFILARLFIHLPLGDVAFRVNLLSAVAGTLTILLVYACGRALQFSNTAALAGAISLAVAHTFWSHAVRAEVYTVFTMLLALILWLLFSWRQERPLALFTAVFLIGPTLLSHQMILLFLPALALFIWLRRDWLAKKEWLYTGVAFTLGLSCTLLLIQTQVGGQNLAGSLIIFFTQSGGDFSRAIFGFSPGLLLADIGFWLALLGLQFAGPALVLAFLGLSAWRQKSPVSGPPNSAALFTDGPSVLWPLLAFYGATVLFAISYRVNDHYVFFLPGYLVVALLISRGWQASWDKRPSLARSSLPLLVIVPILSYAVLPSLLQTVSLPLPTIRELPGRDPVSFFLWPAKNGYQGAAEFGRSALTDLPPNSLLLADHTPYETLNYLQRIEGLRPDIRLIKIDGRDDLENLIEMFGEKRPIYLADNNPAYYNLASLPSGILIPSEMIYKFDDE